MGGTINLTMSKSAQLQTLLETAQTVVVVVANNPDADSLGSALALEEIFSEQGKTVRLYCSADIPVYLHFLEGWARFRNVFDLNYDVAIMVDNSSADLLASGSEPQIVAKLQQRPLIVFDHHASQTSCDFATVHYNDPTMIATGQLIYEIAKQLNWSVNAVAATCLTSSILGDSLGFTSQGMIDNAQPLRVVADLVDKGVNLHQLARKRLEANTITPELISLKGELLQRIDFQHQAQIALLTVSHAEVKQCGLLWNPTVILDEMKFVRSVKISLGFKQYQSAAGQLNRVTLRIRSHAQCQIAQELAQTFGGGGHVFAAGAKWEAAELNFASIYNQVLQKTVELLDKEQQVSDETV